MTDAKVEEVARERVTVRNGDGQKYVLHADLIVLCTGYRATPKEVHGLKDRCRDAHALGDCVKPGRLKDAISEGYRIGCLI
jgi:NADH dehydrogenase FAD-containing subunit